MDFDKLSLNERAELLWSRGKFLVTVNYYNQKVNLYSMDGKYFELWYDVSGNQIEKIIPLTNTKLFSGYLKQN